MTPAEILETVRRLSSGAIADHAEVVDREARWPEAGLRALGEAGLLGLVAPRATGGLGQGLLTLARTCEVIGSECSSTALCFGMHCVGAAVIAAKATEAQTRRYLEPISRGEHITTLALSEPGTGVHFYYPRTTLESLPDGGYRVQGAKAFVTNGGHADSYVVSVQAADDARPGHFSCVMVPGDAPGIDWGEPWDGLGMRGNASRSVGLQGVPIDGNDLLGEEGDQLWYVFQVVAPYFLMAMAGTYLGIATRALELGRSGLEREYEHSGAVLSNAPVLQHRLGTLWATVERTRQLIYFAAEEADHGGERALPALCSAKAEVARCVVEVVNGAMTLGGGRAYRDRSRFDRLLRDARAADVMAPTTDLLTLWTGRYLLGQPLLEE